MKSAIEKYSFGLMEHHVCPFCSKYKGIVKEDTFECHGCNRITIVSENRKAGTVFLYLPLKDQLVALLESLPEHVELIDPKNRTKISPFNYEDIQDGSFYKFIISVDTITINFFIDGLPVRDLFFTIMLLFYAMFFHVKRH